MRNIIRLANDFIVKHNVCTLPLEFDHLQRLCTRLGYKMLPYGGNERIIAELDVEEFTKYAAFAYRHLDIRIVFFDENRSKSTRHFAIAHEIGHIALDHNYQGTVGFTKANTVQEREANTFAYQLLAPLPVLDALNITTLNDIKDSTLLDGNRALHIKLLLLLYKESPNDGKVLKIHGIRRNLHKKSNISLALLFLSATIAVTSILHASPHTAEQLPQATESAQVAFSPLRNINTGKIEALFEETITAATTIPSDDKSETVYVTPHGERYHKENCYHIKNSTPTPTTLADATESGYTPCKSCFK